MTVDEWNLCTNLRRMMDLIAGRVSERKLMLFGCACCYRQWHLIPDSCCKTAVEIAELFADRLCDSHKLRRARDHVRRSYPNLFWYQDYGCHAEAASYFATFDLQAAAEEEAEHPLEPPGDYLSFWKYSEVAGLICAAVSSPEGPSSAEDWDREEAAQCDLLRDIVGNPFRPVTLDPAWRTPTVLALAQRAYDERYLPSGHVDPVLLAALGDALGAAGCDNTEVLGHLRQEGPVHVRGCWVVDCLLEKR